MKRPESLSLPESFLQVHEEEGELRVGSREYSALFREGNRYVDFYDAHESKWASFFIPASVHTAENPDEACALGPAVYDMQEDCVTVKMPVTSTLWRHKMAVWKFRQGVVETYFELEGEGRLTTCHYFGGDYADGKDSGFFPSSADFNKVFCPEPDERSGPVRPQYEPAAVNVTGMGLPGRRDWIFTPAPFCFSFAKEAEDSWLNVDIATSIDEQNFTELRYEPRQQGFSLALDYEAHMYVDGNFKTPSVLLHFAEEPYQGIVDYRRYAEYLGYLEVYERPPTPDWHYEPGFCGWGAQCERAARDGTKDAQAFCQQEYYEEDDRILGEHGIVPGVKTIDDKWQIDYGTNEVDPAKWPDAPGYIERCHDIGQHVLMWFKAWDAGGLDPSLCVRNRQGVPVAADPTNSKYRRLLEDQVDYMLGPHGLNADGLKIDFTARTPSGRTLSLDGDKWGVALEHELIDIIHTTAKRIKPDSMIVGQIPNSWFAHALDVVRENDIFTGLPVIPQMEWRARVARAACHELVIDTDNWPMPSKIEWRRYTKVQPDLGVPWLYFSTYVAGEKMTDADYAAVRRSWIQYRASHLAQTERKNLLRLDTSRA